MDNLLHRIILFVTLKMMYFVVPFHINRHSSIPYWHLIIFHSEMSPR